MKELGVALRITLLVAILGGLLYPLAMTGVAQAAFHDRANGSLVTDAQGNVVGAHLIGQSFYRTTKDAAGNVIFRTTTDKDGNVHFVIDPRYFQSRPPGATATDPADPNAVVPAYNPSASGGSNLGPSNPALTARIEATVADFRAEGVTGDIPIDLVTADFTGFDPDISEAAALVQIPMVARARGLDAGRLLQVVEDHLEGRSLWIFGEPHINVLDLNIALDGGAGR
ncbi:MAG TPA: potassium-transporting ATPase subunit C [Candidatus Dormibacteraeota bacterium]|nr:potassium-transporting ATPase subunit C [Candidatus Dormibacteraeota bacterium]